MINYSRGYLKPLTTQPSVEEVKGNLGLVHGHHVAGAIDLHKGEVTARLDLAVLLGVLRADLEVLDLGTGKALVTGPLKLVGPSLVTEPVANEVGITGIDQDGNLLKDLRDQVVVGLHPVASEEEVSVDVHVAAVVAADLSTKSLLDVLAV